MKKKRFITPARVLIVLAIVVVGGPAVWYGVSGREHRVLDDSARAKSGASFAKLSAGVTRYDVAGDGSRGTVVLVHGATIPSFGWDFQVGALADGGLRVITYDQYGRGMSDRPEAAYDREFYRRQLSDLLDALEVEEKVCLVGHSLGGAIAADFTAEHPDRVRCLVLVGPVVDGVRDMTPFTLVRIPVVGEFAIRTIVPSVLVDRADDYFDNAGPEGSRFKALYRRQMEYEGFEDALLALFRSDMIADHGSSYSKLGRLGIPVMLVWGDEDDDIPKEHIDLLAERIPKLDMRVFEGVGHSPTMECPARLNEVMLDYIVATK